MIIVRLTGGLGNQLFQYAAGRSLAIRKSTRLYFDTSHYSSYENQKLNRTFQLPFFAVTGKELPANKRYAMLNPGAGVGIRALRRLLWGKLTYHIQRDGDHPEIIENQQLPLYIEGNFQSEEYFLRESAIIKHELFPGFTLQHPGNNLLLERIKSSNVVGVHIRRGDYVTDPSAHALHGTCDLSYYNEAMNRMKNKFPHIVFYIFSDDAVWARETFACNPDVEIVEGNCEEGLTADLVEFKLLCHCSHHIIANSSFSWWAAWLNINPAKHIIGPERWFFDARMNQLYQNILPAGWEKI